MLYTVKEHEFMGLMLQKESFSAENQEMFVRVSAAFATKVNAQMGGTQSSLYLYILARTLLIGKAAARITLAEFSAGTSDDIETAGVGVSPRNIRVNLAQLVESGWVDAWRTQAQNGTEKEARMFAIDCKKALAGFDFSQVFSANPLRSPGRQHPSPRMPASSPLLNIHSTYGTGINYQENNRSSGDFAAGTLTEGVVVLPVPKRPRAAATYEQSAAAVLTSVKNGYRVARAARVEAAVSKSAHDMSKLELQAMLDEATTTMIQGKYRLVVTDKEFSVLRKRLRANPPDSFKKFVEFVVANWYSIATKQRAAAKKRAVVNNASEREMPLAPNFRLLCYWYPYFLNVYQSTSAGANYGESEKDKEIARLRRALANKTVEVESIRRVTRSRMRTPPQTDPHHEPANLEVSSDIGSSIDNDLPTWEEATANALKRNKK